MLINRVFPLRLERSGACAEVRAGWPSLERRTFIQRDTSDHMLISVQVQRELARRKAHREYARQQEAAQPMANTTVTVNATSLSAEFENDLPLHQQFLARLTSIRTSSMRVRTSFKV